MYIHSNPIPNRTHKKSYTGCRACKARKVKCDEVKPVCGKCSVHFKNIKSCDYGPSPRLKKKDGSSKKKDAVTAFVAPPTRLQSNEPLSSEGELTTAALNPLHSLQNTRKRAAGPTTEQCPCPCPCHQPEFTNLLLDAVFGICRICGNLPFLTSTANACNPVIPEPLLLAGKVDPFSSLPSSNSPRVHALIYHWVNTLAFFPTRIHSQYCTNPRWLAAAIASPVLFNVTLFVSAVHDAGLHGLGESHESLYYKAQTIRAVNEALCDPEKAVADETLAAVLLLTHVVSVLGDLKEVKTHINGLQQMIKLRGGPQTFTIEGVFLHMLCTTNHLTAVLSESTTLSSKFPHLHLRSISPPATPESPLLKPFALSCGFHDTVVTILYEMGFLQTVLDTFTSRLLPEWREGFTELMKSIEQMRELDKRRESIWRSRWEMGEVGVERGDGWELVGGRRYKVVGSYPTS